MHYIHYIIRTWQDFYLAIESYIYFYLHIDIKQACEGIEDCSPSTYTRGINAAKQEKPAPDLEDEENTLYLKSHKPFLAHHGMKLRLVSSTSEEWQLDIDHIYDLHLLKHIYPNRFEGNKPKDDVTSTTDPKWKDLPFSKKDFNHWVAITPEDWNAQLKRASYQGDKASLPLPPQPLSALTHLLMLYRWLGHTLILDCPKQTWTYHRFPRTLSVPSRKDKYAICMYNTEEQRRLILNRHIYLIRLDGRGGIDYYSIPDQLQYIYILPDQKFWNLRKNDPAPNDDNRHMPYGLYQVHIQWLPADLKLLSQIYHHTPSRQTNTTQYLVIKIVAQSLGMPHLTIETMHKRFDTMTNVQFFTVSSLLRPKYGYIPPKNHF